MKLTALMLAALLAAAGLAAFAEDAATPVEPAEDAPILLATIEGKQVWLDEIMSYAGYLASNGYIESEGDLKNAYDMYVMYQVLPELKVRELGVEAILGDTYETVKAEVIADYHRQLKEYTQNIMQEGYTQEEFDETHQTTLDMFAQSGYGEDVFVEDVLLSRAFSALVDELEITVAPEDIQAEYDAYIDQQRSMFEGNVTMYEMYLRYGYTLEYKPSGYRGVTHILLDVDDEILAAYNAAATDEDKAKAAEDMINSRKADIDAIYARLEAGEAFEALIAEYGTDPGMSGDNLVNGYEVHKDSVTYVAEFTAGAFGDNMLAPGDVSEPVISTFGIHIIYYLRDVPSGASEMSEALRASIEDYLIGLKQDEYFAEWLSAYETVYSDDFGTYIQ